jgi:hypothetical protein
MKRLLLGFICAVLIFSIAGCAAPAKTKEKEGLHGYGLKTNFKFCIFNSELKA